MEMMKNISTKSNDFEFIGLMAMFMALLALSIDCMLPALDQIGLNLGTQNPNDNQLVISTLLLGMSLGLMFFGPISDSYGRKKSIYIGMAIFLIGTLCSILSTNFTFMLIGRFGQGVGGASCRVVTAAMIRDRFSGNEMGRVMSLIMVVFIMVPAFAPTIGQLILLFTTWRAIFGFIFLYGVISLLWLYFRQAETLPHSQRLPFSLQTVKHGVKETITNSVALRYSIAAGAISGAFIGYLSSAQQILQFQYHLDEFFSVYFGGLSLAFGIASYLNSKLVMRFRMESLCLVSMVIHTVASIIFFLIAQNADGHPALYLLMIYIVVVFFSLAIFFGNINALAIEPLGHIAGVATSTISFIQTLLSTVIGALIGQLYNGTVLPMALGYILCGIVSLLMIIRFKTGTKEKITVPNSSSKLTQQE